PHPGRCALPRERGPLRRTTLTWCPHPDRRRIASRSSRAAPEGVADRPDAIARRNASDNQMTLRLTLPGAAGIMRHPFRSPEAALAPVDYARLVDYHVHHDRCGHAVERMEAYVQAALALGLGEMGLSDHLYVFWLPRERRDPEIGMPEEQYPAYIAEAQHLIRVYDGRIRLRLASETD